MSDGFRNPSIEPSAVRRTSMKFAIFDHDLAA